MGGLAFPDANFGGCSLASIHEKAAIYDAIATAASLDEARRVYKERFLMVYPLHKVIQNELYRLAKKSDDIDRWKASRYMDVFKDCSRWCSGDLLRLDITTAYFSLDECDEIWKEILRCYNSDGSGIMPTEGEHIYEVWDKVKPVRRWNIPPGAGAAAGGAKFGFFHRRLYTTLPGYATRQGTTCHNRQTFKPIWNAMLRAQAESDGSRCAASMSTDPTSINYTTSLSMGGDSMLHDFVDLAADEQQRVAAEFRALVSGSAPYPIKLAATKIMFDHGVVLTDDAITKLNVTEAADKQSIKFAHNTERRITELKQQMDDKRLHYRLQRDPRGRMLLRDDALILRRVFVTYAATNGVAFEEAAARIQDHGEANGCSWVNCEYEREDPLKPALLPDAFYPSPVHHCLNLEDGSGTLKVANQTKILVCCPEHTLAEVFWMSCFDVEPRPLERRTFEKGHHTAPRNGNARDRKLVAFRTDTKVFLEMGACYADGCVSHQGVPGTGFTNTPPSGNDYRVCYAEYCRSKTQMKDAKEKLKTATEDIRIGQSKQPPLMGKCTNCPQPCVIVPSLDAKVMKWEAWGFCNNTGDMICRPCFIALGGSIEHRTNASIYMPAEEARIMLKELIKTDDSIQVLKKYTWKSPNGEPRAHGICLAEVRRRFSKSVATLPKVDVALARMFAFLDDGKDWDDAGARTTTVGGPSVGGPSVGGPSVAGPRVGGPLIVGGPSLGGTGASLAGPSTSLARTSAGGASAIEMSTSNTSAASTSKTTSKTRASKNGTSGTSAGRASPAVGTSVQTSRSPNDKSAPCPPRASRLKRPASDSASTESSQAKTARRSRSWVVPKGDRREIS